MAPEQAAEEFVLKVSDSEFVYYDSGVPSGAGEPYTTVIFVHGILFNHRIWQPLLSVVPPKTRLLAHSTRGLAESSPFSSSDLASKVEIRERLGEDLASTITAYISKLNLLEHPESKIKLVVWSLSGLAVVSTYDLLRHGKLSAENAITLEEKISEIFFYEPPVKDVLGFEKSASTNAVDAWAATVAPEKMLDTLTSYITGIWDYPADVFTELEQGKRVLDRAWEMKSTLWDDEKFKGWVEEEKVADPASLAAYNDFALEISEAGRTIAKGALETIVKANGVGRVTVLVAKRSLPQCIEGSAGIINILNEIDGGTAKKHLHIAEGPWNHVFHYQAPKEFWGYIV